MVEIAGISDCGRAQRLSVLRLDAYNRPEMAAGCAKHFQQCEVVGASDGQSRGRRLRFPVAADCRLMTACADARA